MSERMTAEELLKLCDLDPKGMFPAQIDAIQEALRHHLRASQTPPHAVTGALTDAEKRIALIVFLQETERAWTGRTNGYIPAAHVEPIADAILALLAEKPAPGAQLVKQCPRCKGTGDDPVQGHPDHHFKCDLCDGYQFIREKPASTSLTETQRKTVDRWRAYIEDGQLPFLATPETFQDAFSFAKSALHYIDRLSTPKDADKIPLHPIEQTRLTSDHMSPYKNGSERP